MRRFLRRAAFVALLIAPATRADDSLFDVQVIPSRGRTAAAEIADLDGDGRADLLQAVIHEMPPDERRVLRLYLQRADGSIPGSSDLEWPIPGSVAAYDVGDVDDVPGVEVLLLRPRGLLVASFARDDSGVVRVRERELRIPGERTLGVAVDERGMDRLRIANRELGAEPRLVVPGLDETFLLAADGSLRGRIRSGARANYFVAPPGPMLGESDIQLFLDAPRISVGDVNGDGRPEIVAASRHELRIFHGRETGGYGPAPDAVIPLRRLSYADHIRGSGSVRSTARDIDGDGLADLLLSLTMGSLMNARSETAVYLNRGKGWDFDHPDATFHSEKTLGADQLVDLDGDGRLELLRTSIPIGVLELVEIFVQRALDARLEVHRIERAAADPAGAEPARDPLFTLDLDLPLDLETSRLAGFVPSVAFDVNGDGFVDFLGGGDGTRLDVRLGGADGRFERSGSQELVTEGQIRGGDVDGDGLPDFVLFNSRRRDAPVRLLVNRGLLPGTPADPRLAPPSPEAGRPGSAGPPRERGEFGAPDWVEVAELEPGIRLDLRYASADNFVGRPLYPQARAFLQRPAAEALVRAHRALRAEGYGIVVFDAYRPWSVTRDLWNAATPEQRARGFVADPQQGSRHNRGCAVDVTLYSLASGEAVPMPSGFDEFGERASPDYAGGSPESRANRDRLRRAMEEQGFAVYESEWWHFDFRDWRRYRVADDPFEAIGR